MIADNDITLPGSFETGLQAPGFQIYFNKPKSYLKALMNREIPLEEYEKIF